MKKSIPKIREREGNENNPFPKFRNGKRMKKIHSHNLGMGIRGYQSVAGAATDDTSHVLLRGAVTLNTSHKSESFVISQPLGFSPIQT